MPSVDAVIAQQFYHGTRVDLERGDLIAVGYNSNFGKGKPLSWVYLTGTLDAAIWGAELAAGEGRERIYIVEPTGPIFDDPNLTDQKISRQPDAVLPFPRAAQGHGVGEPPSRTAAGDERPSRSAEGARYRGNRLIRRSCPVGFKFKLRHHRFFWWR
jgi:hypothetical protein